MQRCQFPFRLEQADAGTRRARPHIGGRVLYIFVCMSGTARRPTPQKRPPQNQRVVRENFFRSAYGKTKTTRCLPKKGTNGL